MSTTSRPGARAARPGAFASLLACAALLGALLAPQARAQGPAAPEPRSVLLILDASDSMNEDAGDGTTRLDAAKAALDSLADVLPADAQVGLRVYGASVSGAGRRAGCRDTQLLVAPGRLDRDALRARVHRLQGRGRTPIGRALRAAPDDLPSEGKRTVVLVSDGGDNCAPPDPCRAAEDVAQRGVDLTISVVGLQVNERVRRQLRCIADAGGGAYVDAGDPDALRRELLAAIARAFRDYRPVGTPVTGGADGDHATALGAGQFLDTLHPGEERWYAVRVRPAQRLFAATTAIPPLSNNGRSAMSAELLGPDGGRVAFDRSQLGSAAGNAQVLGNLLTFSLRTPQVRARGIPSDADPGVYLLRVVIEEGADPEEEVPVEIAVQALDPGERPAFVRAPGALPAALGARRAPGSPRPARRGAAARQEDDGDSTSAPALAGAGALGLLAGLLGGGAALARRRRP